MAEVLNDAEALQQSASKPSRSSHFSTVQDLVIVREVAAAKAHTVNFREAKKLLEQAALKVLRIRRLRT